LGLHTSADETRAVTIDRVVKETPDITTLHFHDEREARPGQYFMIWVPGSDEVPMSISSIDGGNRSVSVRAVGETTRALGELRIGDRVGVRGPCGNGFRVKGSRPLLVGGGTGITPLTVLAEQMVSAGVRPSFLAGVRSRDQVLFMDRLGKLLGDHLIISTDDGSYGLKGLASVYAIKMLEENSYDHIYLCGPELMMAKVFEAAETKGVPVQASLERYVKCSFGLCGSCAIGPYRVCRDGPVFDSEMLRSVKDEFGCRRMDQAGRMISVGH
jgi:dihydroorotate dehydrogenase electron transfer subunit